MKDKCGQIVKTKKIIDRENDRVEKVKRAREKAVQNAMEKSAKLILQERRYESNTKRFEKELEMAELDRRERFQSLNMGRNERRQRTLEADQMLEDKGHRRYKKDHREIEKRLAEHEKQEQERIHAGYLRLHQNMENIEQKKKAADDLFDIEVLEAFEQRTALEKKLAKKAEKQVSNMLKVKEKCQNQHDQQDEIYRKKMEIDENRLLHHSENALKKYNSV